MFFITRKRLVYTRAQCVYNNSQQAAVAAAAIYTGTKEAPKSGITRFPRKRSIIRVNPSRHLAYQLRTYRTYNGELRLLRIYMRGRRRRSSRRKKQREIYFRHEKHRQLRSHVLSAPRASASLYNIQDPIHSRRRPDRRREREKS